MIKNWTVTTERLKNKSLGLAEYASYLISPKHKNHKNTEIKQLFKFVDKEKFVSRVIDETIEFDSRNKKGGRRVESYAQSFNFVLPKPYKPTIEQWRSIAKDLIRRIFTDLKIEGDVNSFAKNLFINLHDQSNPHINLIVPRIYNGIRLSELDKKPLLRAIKSEFNKSVFTHCKIDHKGYIPIQQNVGKKRSQWQNDKALAELTTEKLHKDIKLIESQSIKSSVIYNNLLEKSDSALTLQASIQELLLLSEEKISTLGRLQRDIERDASQIKKYASSFKYVRSMVVDFSKELFKWLILTKKENILDEMVQRQELENLAENIIAQESCSASDIETLNEMVNLAVHELVQNDVKHIRPIIPSWKSRKLSSPDV